MANEVSVDIKITGLDSSSKQINNLEKSLSSLGKASTSSSSSLKSITGMNISLASSLKYITGVAAAAGTAIAGAFAVKEVVSAAIESENSINRMNLSLAAVGEYSEQTSKAMQDFASQMQQTTRYSDDQVLSSASLLSTMTNLNVEGLQKGTKASADLAAALGIDLETATSLVAKATEGNTGALSRYGIKVKAGTTESERFANVLEALAKYQGRAAADSDTFGGALIKLKNSFDDNLEAIGKIIIENPVFIAAINKAASFMFKFSEYIMENKDSMIELTNKGILLVAQAFEFLIPYIVKISTVFSNLIGVVRLVIQGWRDLIDLASGFTIFRDIFNGIIDAITQIATNTLITIKIFTDLAASSSILKSTFEKAGISIDDMSKGIDGAIESLQEYKHAALKADVAGALKSGLNGVDAVLAKTQDASKQTESVLKNTAATLNTVLSAASKKVPMVNGPKRTAEEIAAIKKIEDAYTKLVEEIAGAEGGATGKIDAEYEKRWKIAEDYLAKNKSKTDEVYAVMEQINEDYYDKLAEQLEKDLKATEEANKKKYELAKANPLSLITNNFIPAIEEEIKIKLKPEVLGSIEGFSTALAKGAEGATDLLVNGAALAIDAFAPGVGQAMKPLLNLFAQGPEVVKKTVKEFITQIPVIIKNLVDSLPALIDAVIESLPLIIDPLVNTLITKISNPVFWTQVAYNAITAFITQIPNIVSEMVSAIWDSVKDIFSFGGGGDSQWYNPFSWSKGGMPVYAQKGVMFEPKGTDTVPSMLTPGELVVDRSTTKQLQNYLNDAETGTSNDVTNALLTQVISLLQQPQTVETSVTLNNKTLADIILNLNRTNARLA